MVFDATKTDMSFYNQLLTKPEYMAKAKGLVGQIMYMHPDEYMRQCAIIHKCTIEREYMAIDERNMESILKYVNEGNLLPMLTLDYAGQTQEGRHRAVLAKRLGYAQVPVLVVTRI